MLFRSGTDLAIVAYLVRELLTTGGCDERYLSDHVHERDLEVLRAAVDEWTAEQASEVTGCDVRDLHDLIDKAKAEPRKLSIAHGGTDFEILPITEYGARK